ncbi:MAG: hypothetical protein II175_07775 [Schwartzia sp.]|nr:hypothetical protein [Schwartzia sp. (in: firmicutes)]
MDNNEKEDSFSTIKAVLIALFIIFCMVIPSISEEMKKRTYRADIDLQYKRIYEYSIEPLSSRITNKVGGSYFATVEYGHLSEEEKSILLSEIKKDGFRYPHLERYRDGKHFCKDKIAIAILDDKSEKIRIMIVDNEYDGKNK